MYLKFCNKKGQKKRKSDGASEKAFVKKLRQNMRKKATVDRRKNIETK